MSSKATSLSCDGQARGAGQGACSATANRHAARAIASHHIRHFIELELASGVSSGLAKSCVFIYIYDERGASSGLCPIDLAPRQLNADLLGWAKSMLTCSRGGRFLEANKNHNARCLPQGPAH